MEIKKTLGRRAISLLLTLLMVLSLIPLSAISAYAEEAPVLNADGYYVIENYDDLCWYRDKVNSGSESINAILMNDIVINENVLDADGNLNSGTFSEWDEIGERFDGPTLVGFHGIFDGNGKTISGVYNTFSQGGFFRQNYGTVKNLNIVDSYFSCSSFCGSTNYGTIINCSSSATINSDGFSGGISQYNDGTIESCTFTGKITTYSDPWAVGGICARNSSVIKNCYSSASISGTSAIGGISGGNSGTVENCYSTGTITIPSTLQGRECYGITDGTVVNSYYIDTSMNSGGDAVAVSQAQFESGEVAYKLGEPWGQKIGTDKSPILGGDKVYKGVNCDGSDLYGNTLEIRVHNFINGFCMGCNGFEPATDENDDGVYEISNPGQLYWFADKVSNDNENFGSANAILTADIVVNEGEITAQSKDAREWTPIGTSSNEYSGIFDGNNHYISGLYFNNSDVRYFGLISCLSENGVVKNIGLINSYIYGSALVGGVVGYNRGTVTNCYNEGTIGGYSNIGGVVGDNRGTVTNCYNVGVVSGSTSIGGVVGWNNSIGTITNCYYLDTTCIGGVDGSDVDGSAESKTAEAFAIGEVAYLLQGEQEELVWGQSIGTDIFPILGGDKVYYGYITCAESDDTIGYTNIVTSLQAKPEHDFVNGFCTGCSKACEHNWDDSVCTVCGKACEHNWDDGTCTVCGKVCEHNWYYGTCEVCGKNCNHSKCDAKFSWENYDGSCYASVELTCADCQQYADSYGDYAELVEEVEAVDCMHPGSKTYTFSYEYNGEIYSDTKTFEVKSDNHIGEFTNGFCSVCNGYEPATFDEDNYVYEISNAGQLYWYAQQANENNSEIPAILTKDIVIPENAPNWEPINCSSAYFDGNFKTISGLKCIGGDKEYVGLFGCEGWWYEISNLHITDSYFEGTSYVGAVVACMTNGGYVTNCYVTNTTVNGDSSDVGALVGSLGISNVVNCYADTDTLVGYYNDSYGNVENSYYLADEDDGLGGKTAQQFKSGEVAYLLQSGITGDEYYDEDLEDWVTVEPEHIWGQNIEEEDFPVFGGDKVYCGYVDCEATDVSYSNSKLNETMGHSGGTATCYAKAVCDYCSESYGDLLEHDINYIDGYCTNEGCTYKVPFFAERYLDWDGDYSYETYSFDTINEAFKYATADGSGYIPEKASVTIHSDAVVSSDATADRCKFDFIVKEDATLTIAENYTVDLSYLDASNINIDGKVIVNGTLILPEGVDAISIKGNLKGSNGTVYVGERQFHFLEGNLICYKPHEYEDSICKHCGFHCWHRKVVGGYCYYCKAYCGADNVVGYTISLGDKIAVNYHMQLGRFTIEDADAKMVFTVPNGDSPYTVEIPVSEATKTEDGYYVFTCEVAAKEMASKIKAQIVTSDSESEVFEYSVKEYAEYILKNPDEYAKEQELVKAMLNYGANAQVYFDYNTENLANASLDEADKALLETLDLSAYASAVSGEEEGVSLYGGVLSLKSETAIKLYFEIDNSIDVNALDVTVNGEAAVFDKNGKYYELKISDIPAHKLNEMYEVKVGGLTVNYGAFSYGNTAMGTDKDVLKNTIKSLYAYNLAAREYLKPDCATCGNTGTITAEMRCDICNGVGSVNFIPCNACFGVGIKEYITDCPDCGDDN